MKGASLTLTLIIAFNFANPCFSQFPEECLSLTTSMFCGTPPITREQIRQIQAATDTINRIEEIGGPVVEGSQEAAELGISMENPIVDLTFRQENFYRRCESTNVSSPANEFPEGFRRKKRQTQASNICCSPSPNTVRVLATVDENGGAVQVIQTPAMAQLFQDTSNCPSTTCSGAITCGTVSVMMRVEVITLTGDRMARPAKVVANICGAVSTT